LLTFPILDVISGQIKETKVVRMPGVVDCVLDTEEIVGHTHGVVNADVDVGSYIIITRV
jgi:hypothetical protein